VPGHRPQGRPQLAAARSALGPQGTPRGGAELLRTGDDDDDDDDDEEEEEEEDDDDIMAMMMTTRIMRR
jgi:ribosomal protein L12E/L44/L45/RPP1/RPP2